MAQLSTLKAYSLRHIARPKMKLVARGVHQPNEPDNPIQTAPTQPEAFGLGGRLRISQPE